MFKKILEWIRKVFKKKKKKADSQEIAEQNPEAVFGDLNLDPSNSGSGELPDDGSVKVAYDADGNGYYVSYNEAEDSYFDPYSGEAIDISEMYDAEGNPFSFFPQEASSESSGDYWEQFVGVDGYGYYDEDNN